MCNDYEHRRCNIGLYTKQCWIFVNTAVEQWIMGENKSRDASIFTKIDNKSQHRRRMFSRGGHRATDGSRLLCIMQSASRLDMVQNESTCSRAARPHLDHTVFRVSIVCCLHRQRHGFQPYIPSIPQSYRSTPACPTYRQCPPDITKIVRGNLDVVAEPVDTDDVTAFHANPDTHHHFVRT